MPFDRDRSLIGVKKLNSFEDDRDIQELVNHMGRSPRNLERDDSSLESIGQFGFTDPFSVHAMSRGNSFASIDDCSMKRKRVTWQKNVKMGNDHVGCMSAFGACSSLPANMDGAHRKLGCTVDNATTETQNFLRRFAGMAVSNVQKCGIGSQCGVEGAVLNVEALRSMIGGEECMRYGAVDRCDVANRKCAQCQSYFHDKRVARQHKNFKTGAETELLQETRGMIKQSRDSIIVPHSAILETRMDVLHSEEELREMRNCQTAFDAHWDDCNGKWREEVVCSPKSILKKKVSFSEDVDENNCHVPNIRSPRNMRLGQVERKSIQNPKKKRVLGRFAVKLAKPMDVIKHGMAKPIDIVKHGIKRNGPKRILAVTSRRY